MATVRLRKGAGTPAPGLLADGEPAVDMTPGAPRLYVGISGATVVLADPVYIASLEARIRLLEQALRELQFIAHTGVPTFVIPP